MTQDLIDVLNKDGEPTPEHQALLTHAKSLAKISRQKMSTRYSDWDLQDEVYRGIRYPDKKDKKAAEKGEPEKMVVPNTFAQVMTFSSFLFLMLNQNKNFFELDNSGDEDAGTKMKDIELVLRQQVRNNKWNTLLFQHLLDVARFGTAPMECSWTRDVTRAYVTPEPQMVTIGNITVPVHQGSSWEEFVKYEGNLVRAVSPYHFFPDTRLPLVDFQRGEFCGSEEMYSIGDLKRLERAGEVAGISHIQAAPTGWEDARGGVTRSTMELNDSWRNNFSTTNTRAMVLVTKMQIRIVPSMFDIGVDKKLGPEEFPVMYHLWYANDNRVIRCEPAQVWHDKFGYTLSQFTPDMHHTLTLGLADLVYRLQDVISWFVNAHITSVRRVMNNRFVVNPMLIDTKSLDGEGDIYLRAGVNAAFADKAVRQLQVQDVTGGHMGDVDMLGRLMEVVTGVNGNAMGQYNSGRRSATESRNVNAGAAGRMKMHGSLIWETNFNQLGQMMTSNSRQALSEQMFSLFTGSQDPARYAAFKGTPQEVICGSDYFNFDSTLSSERGFMAQSLQELFSAIVSSNPQAAQEVTQQLNPVKLIDEIQYMRGAGNVSRFRYSQEEMAQRAQAQQEQMAQQAQMQNQPQPIKASLGIAAKITDLTTEERAQLLAKEGIQSSQENVVSSHQEEQAELERLKKPEPKTPSK